MSAVPHPSDSAVQRSVEKTILEILSDQIGKDLKPAQITFDDGVTVHIDGVTEDRSVLVEVYAHIGKLRGAQPRKLATDALKLRWAGERLQSQRLILAVADAEVENYLTRQRAWLTAAIADAGVEVIRADLGDEMRAEVIAAQTAQYR